MGLLVSSVLCVLIAILWSLLSLFGNPDSGINLFLNTEYTIPLIIIHVWVYGVIAFWCFTQIRTSNLSIVRIFGSFPQKVRELKLLIFAIPVFLFSLGIGQLTLLVVLQFFQKNFDPIWLANPLILVVRSSSSLIYQVLLIAIVVILEPALEEVCFRGLILQRLATKWNWKVAILISSLMFGILHANIIGFFVFGIVLSVIYLQTRVLWIPWLLHLSYNAIALWAGQLSSSSLFPMAGQNLEQLISSWRNGIICISFVTPWLLLYILKNWPSKDRKIPYEL
nr:CPBP family intramembrane glutamic endopeptidase [Oscillatoria sp. FACHB-1406]